MKNTFGQSITVTLFGESHGEAIGAVLDGLAPGMTVSEDSIRAALVKRRPDGHLSTARIEEDDFSILSGAVNGKATGTPLCILIPNNNTRSGDYQKNARLARPGHADYTAECKYHGFQDARGGGHFSARLTAALVAAGAIVKDALLEKGIRIGIRVAEIAGIPDGDASPADITALSHASFPVVDEMQGERMKEAIRAAASEGDSVGGILEGAVTGIPAGVGEPWFDSVESILSHMLFSIPAVKGVEFGAGFALAKMRGSEANDPFRKGEQGTVTATNHNGGINGGITNGMPITFRLAVKPTPSIYKKQETVSLDTGENEEIAIAGRHDPCVVHRAAAVAEACTALAVADLLAARYGTDYFLGK